MLFPDGGIFKGELAAYYEAVAPLMLPHLRGRPVTMERYPSSIDKKGSSRRTCRRATPGGWSGSTAPGRARPCTWDELASGAALSRTFTLRTLPDRIARVGDLWEELA